MQCPEIESGPRARWSAFDLLIYCVCVFLGAIQFVFYERSNDFVSDVTFYELARSLIEKGWYGYNTRPETIFPPGEAALVGLVLLCFGNSHTTLTRSTAVFATLFLIASYELLRRHVGRGPAGAISLIIGSSPFFFHFSTHVLLADIPYAFTTTMALVAADFLNASKTKRARAGAWLSFMALLACSLMLRSAALAMLAALAAWLAISFIVSPAQARMRLKAYLPALVIGIAIQGLWMSWARNHEQRAWPSLNGYPGSYTSQLFLKQGNDPEAGPASLADMYGRVRENLVGGSSSLLEILSRRWIEPAWNSPLILASVLLMLLGLRSSNWVDSSGLIQWYFVSYVMMYLLWPWEFDKRFILPVAPLASMYLWRGCLYLASNWGITLSSLGRHRNKIQIVFVFLSIPMAVYSALLLVEHRQGKQPTFFWLLLAACSVSVPWIKSRLAYVMSRLSLRNTRQTVAAILVLGVVAVGLFIQIRMGIKNLEFDLEKQPNYPDIEAARWIMSHTNPDAVVMARNESLIQHYSGRRIILLPPSRDPQLLMSGIIKYRIEWIVVTDADRWFSPRDNECFAPLARAYPDGFQLVHQGPRNRVFQVARNLPELTRQPVELHPSDHPDHREM
jgi:hypothetical protein